ncbi:hypothetical protein [Methyloceanibacter caenitepidi]|uniref:Uncharacterized protein n=1 Tax=Methyloceanibacter caenitepidi TaxID=1384459 RepID=A0A0A8K5S2_9HYPH|nr:hypothetical protein [Methyloceanibacter caenitepidi]BAQ18293.1 hypothetical protein GL4_2860 [Methyloceanibacter caenitepidi]
MTDLQDANYISSGDRSEGEAKQFLEDVLAREKEMPGGAAQSELTIASGAVTPVSALHTIDTESDDSSDTLDTLAITTLSEGAIVYLWAENAARTVTVQHLNAGADGEVSLAGAANKALSTSTPLVLKRVGVQWVEVRFGDTSALEAQIAERIGSYRFADELTLPDSCLACDGLTIGDGSSGATSRANDDTWPLFEKRWAVGNANGTYAIYDSGGGASTYGANAAADFAAHKRLALPDWHGPNKSLRAADGTDLDVGEVQADGAPDIDATFTEVTAYGSGTATGAVSRTKDQENRPASGSADGRYSYTFAASADDPTYSDSVDEIRVNAIGVLVGIYFR